jgi:hypothetical protein
MAKKKPTESSRKVGTRGKPAKKAAAHDVKTNKQKPSDAKGSTKITNSRKKTIKNKHTVTAKQETTGPRSVRSKEKTEGKVVKTRLTGRKKIAGLAAAERTKSRPTKSMQQIAFEEKNNATNPTSAMPHLVKLEKALKST